MTNTGQNTRLDVDTVISLVHEALAVPPASPGDQPRRDRVVAARAHALVEALRPLTTAALAAHPTQEEAAYWTTERITGLRRTLAYPELAYEPAPEPELPGGAR